MTVLKNLMILLLKSKEEGGIEEQAWFSNYSV